MITHKTKKMKFQSKLFVLLLIFILTNCSDYRQRINTSHNQIDTLKENILLVRLNTFDEKVKRLGQTKGKLVANKERAAIDARNDLILKSFENHFDFCSVYFFYSADGSDLKAGHLSAVTFYNSNWEEVNRKLIRDKTYLVGEFAQTYADQLIYEDEEGNRRVAAGTNGLPALVVLDEDYIQLAKPFPSEIRLAFSDEEKAVYELNKALHRFYGTAQKKKIRRALRKKSRG